MFAIIQTGGKQYKVSPGDVLRVESIDAKAKDALEFANVLLVSADDKVLMGRPYVEGASVRANVLNHGKAKKVIVFKKKRRKQYRRTRGHRQRWTEIKIEEINFKEAKNGS